MPNTKSAIKRVRQSEKRTQRNRYFKSTARTYMKRARRLIESGELTEAEAVIVQAYRALDKAAQKGAIHKNKAARNKARLMKALNRARTAA